MHQEAVEAGYNQTHFTNRLCIKMNYELIIKQNHFFDFFTFFDFFFSYPITKRGTLSPVSFLSKFPAFVLNLRVTKSGLVSLTSSKNQ